MIALLFLLGCGRVNDNVKRPGHPDYIKTYDEKLMARAIQKAKDTQQDFVKALQSKTPSMNSFAIKRAFPAGKEGEHIWLSDVSWDGRVFEATVDNEPVETKTVKMGDRVHVTPEELSDWMYVDDGVLKGGYTVRVLHYQSSPAEQKEFLRHVDFSIPPIDF